MGGLWRWRGVGVILERDKAKGNPSPCRPSAQEVGLPNTPTQAKRTDDIPHACTLASGELLMGHPSLLLMGRFSVTTTRERITSRPAGWLGAIACSLA